MLFSWLKSTEKTRYEEDSKASTKAYHDIIKVLYEDQERCELRAFKGYSGDQKATVA